MTTIRIDTEELAALSTGTKHDIGMLSDLSLSLTRSWAAVGGVDAELGVLQMDARQIQLGLDSMGERLHAVAQALDDQVREAQFAESGAASYLAILSPLMLATWSTTLAALLVAAGPPNPTFGAFQSAAAPFGLTTNPALNQLLGTAAAAPSLLAPTGIVPGSGVDLNAQALGISMQIGVENALAGKGPLYANGALQGMSNTLGIAFPGEGSTVSWAENLQRTHDARIASGGDAGSGGSVFRANPNYYGPTGRNGELLIHPTSPSFGIMKAPS
jgi:hypothetical protein